MFPVQVGVQPELEEELEELEDEFEEPDDELLDEEELLEELPPDEEPPEEEAPEEELPEELEEASMQAGEPGRLQLELASLQQGSSPGKQRKLVVPVGQFGTRPDEQRIPFEQNTAPLEEAPEEEPEEELEDDMQVLFPVHVPTHEGTCKQILSVVKQKPTMH